MTTLGKPVDPEDFSEALVTIRGSGGPGADSASGGTGSKTGVSRWRDLHPLSLTAEDSKGAGNQ